jgi:hypothetical protein
VISTARAKRYPITSATAPTADQEATGGDAEERQQEDKANRDAGDQRQRIPQQGQRDHRQHETDHESLAQGQPGRPTRSQAQSEDKAARNQR